MPFSESEEEYFETYELLIENDNISSDLKTYLKKRHLTRQKWVKAYMKTNFCCGTCTTSRIEAKHRIYKAYLNGNSRLCEIFLTFQKLEKQEVTKFEDEIIRLSKPTKTQLNKNDFIKTPVKWSICSRKN